MKGGDRSPCGRLVKFPLHSMYPMEAAWEILTVAPTVESGGY